MKTVTLAEFRPSRRADGLIWTEARAEAAASPDADNWEAVETIGLDPLDVAGEEPALRSFTVATSKDWLRLVFIDESGGEAPQPPISASPYPFRPSSAEVASILRARTYSKGEVDPDEPLAAVAGGELTEEFDETTRPNARAVEKAIDQACVDVLAAVGYVPGEKIGEARRVAALKAAAECERAYIPEQAEGKGAIYQTLRMTASEELGRLVSNLWVWTIANRGLQ